MAAATFEAKSWVWLPDEEEAYLPAQVVSTFKRGDRAQVETEDGTKYTLDAKTTNTILAADEQVFNSKVDNLIKLNDLNECALLHNLRLRFNEDVIYTYVSSILISVNPFKLLPLYTPEVLDQYKQGSRNLPPHVFSVADEAYRNMLADKANQSCVISGESGAGKTEATKLILQFLAEVSGRADVETERDASLEQQILQANPVMESFGNAKTVRNNNSSRFGKLITINFSTGGKIVGGSIINYLLEKSRVVHQMDGERNYHVFYEVLAGVDADPALKKALHLTGVAEDYNFLNQSGVTHIENLSDEKEFEDMRTAMDTLNIDKEKQLNVFRIVAGLLHVGNVEFEAEVKATEEDGAKVKNKDVLATACELLGIDADAAKQCLCFRNIGTRSVIMVSYTPDQARDARDAMVKNIYSKLFNWLIARINDSLASMSSKSGAGGTFIGVLDIFGFESFEVNSFEQLCINYCNEKLQFHFNEHIFRLEQEEYGREGVTVANTDYADNQPCLDLIELKGTGLLSMIDEETSVPKGSDEGFLSKALTKLKSHPNFSKPRPKQAPDVGKCFVVVHYAGEVAYNVTNFLEKTKDSVHADITSTLQRTTSPVMKACFPAAEAPEVNVRSVRGRRNAPGKKGETLGTQFKKQLTELMTTLNATSPHFVRCMKPNSVKKGDIFESPMMLAQLRYAGLLEVCRIRQIGYPVRREFEAFQRLYKPLLPAAKTVDALLAGLQKEGLLEAKMFAKGNTKVFLKNQAAANLDEAREKAFDAVAKSVQKIVRGFLAQCRYKAWKKTLKDVAAATKSRDCAALDKAVGLCAELPFRGSHLASVKAAKELLSRLVEEENADKMLVSALESREVSALQIALATAAGLTPPLQNKNVEAAHALVTKLQQEKELRDQLKAATRAKSLKDLDALLKKAAAQGLVSDETQQAQAVKARLEEEAQVEKALKAALKKKDKTALADLVVKATEMGMDLPEIEKAKKLCSEAAAEAAAAHTKKVNTTYALLKTTAAAGDLEGLNNALAKVLELGLERDERVTSAEVARDELQISGESVNSLKAAQSSLESKAYSAAGIQGGDAQLMKEALDRAAAAGVKPDDAAMVAGQAFFNNLKTQLVVQADLAVAAQHVKDSTSSPAEGPTLKSLVACLSTAEELGLQLEAMTLVRERVRLLDRERRQRQAVGAPEEGDDEDDEDEEAAERARQERLRKAANKKYQFINFSGIRNADDFARGVILNKKKVKDGMLRWQGTLITKSLLDIDKDLSKYAVRVHKCLLGYMGDKTMSFPATLAQDILQKGLEFPELVDEIYMLIMKQLSGNPKPESMARGWQVMCMCVGTFPPSRDFEMYLLNYILERKDALGAVGNYARYALRRLEGMLSSGASGFLPSVEEIQAYKERPPILATIELVDGTPLTEELPITPDLNVGKVLEICTHFLDLKDYRANTFSIFVVDEEENRHLRDSMESKFVQHTPVGNDPGSIAASLMRCPRPLRSEDFMGDVVVQKARQGRRYRFVFKRKIFLRAADGGSDDEMFNRLIYLQAADEVTSGNVPMADEAELVKYTTLAMGVDLAEDMPSDVAGLVENALIEYVPLPARADHTPEEWAGLVLKQRSLVGDDAEELQETYVRMLKEKDLYGTHFFHVRKLGDSPATSHLPDHLVAGFNSEGLHFMDPVERRVLASFGYADVYRWGGSSVQFSLIIWNADTQDTFELVLTTSQAADMAALILDYINAIMASTE